MHAPFTSALVLVCLPRFGSQPFVVLYGGNSALYRASLPLPRLQPRQKPGLCTLGLALAWPWTLGLCDAQRPHRRWHSCTEVCPEKSIAIDAMYGITGLCGVLRRLGLASPH